MKKLIWILGIFCTLTACTKSDYSPVFENEMGSRFDADILKPDIKHYKDSTGIYEPKKIIIDN